MPLAGRQLSIASALAACRAAGWADRGTMIDVVSVMCAESARFTKAFHDNEDGSRDRGLFQINNHAHPSVSDDEAYKPAFNVTYAHRMWRASGFKPWAAYNSGAYLQFGGMVAEVYDRGTWRLRVPLWRARIAAL